jgi:adenylate cyclase
VALLRARRSGCQPGPVALSTVLPVEGDPDLARKLFYSTGVRLLVANVVCGLLVSAQFEVTSSATPRPQAALPGWLVDIGLFLVYGAIGLIVGWIALARFGNAAWGGAARGEPPADAQREAALRLPLRMSAVIAAIWALIAVVTPALNYSRHHVTLAALRVLIALAFAGVAATVLTAVLVEQNLKPLYARVLGGRPPERRRIVGVRRSLLLFWAVGFAIPVLAIVATPLALTEKQRGSAIAAMAVLAGVGLVSSLVFTLVGARSVADPITDVRQAMARVAAGELETEIPVDDDGEIGLLQAGFNHMAGGLREREQLRELFGGYVGEEVARQAVESGVSLEGEERDVSALFVDLVGSTALAEHRSPVEVVAMLNQFFDVVISAVDTEGGWVNKFEGDAALCVFGAPMAQADHAARALRAATAMRAALSTLPGLDAGIGVSSGVVVAGNIGSSRRYEYTVVGDPVNEAARLTDLAKHQPGRIVVSERSVKAAGAYGDEWRTGECVTLRGRSQPTQTFVPA